MEEVIIVFLIEGLKETYPCLETVKIVPNIIKSATFQAKIHTNGKKQIKIKTYTTNLNIFVCNGGHGASSKEFKDIQDFEFSGFQIRILEDKPKITFGKVPIYDFLNVPIQSNVIYWVSYKTKNHKTLVNRGDVFCLLDGNLTNKLIFPRHKINKKYERKKKNFNSI
ncbi:MAG: hypothetical protein BWY04_00378 [candidate division CPR1 bacterium ADurb.Bin160]|jgi:hypothetical protein|uniref:Uncharacterized protein n=1 Tax=candidate division CPR1 bacterium ADurb.Bin160 TaxID=1852826 RepID=A0A1V5ZPP1_9BACT|nr:MAG: hypothetical protein BWY04_00378 [candidate division CPR1 bacterium ADurb.Bin160]